GNNTLLHITYKGGASGHDVVLGVDGPPTVTHFADQNVCAGATVGPLPFTVTDDFTDPSALTIRVDSSNPLLVDPANIVIGGTGSARASPATAAPKGTARTRGTP